MSLFFGVKAMEKIVKKYEKYTEKKKHLYFFRITYEYSEKRDVPDEELDKFQWQFVTLNN